MNSSNHTPQRKIFVVIDVLILDKYISKINLNAQTDFFKHPMSIPTYQVLSTLLYLQINMSKVATSITALKKNFTSKTMVTDEKKKFIKTLSWELLTGVSPL